MDRDRMSIFTKPDGVGMKILTVFCLCQVSFDDSNLYFGAIAVLMLSYN